MIELSKSEKQSAKRINYLSKSIQEKQNIFSYIMDFDYYIENGLLTDEMFQSIALFQATAETKYTTLIDKNKEYTTKKVELNKLVGTVKYGKLDVSKITYDDYITLILNDPPFIYRTDEDEKDKDKFRVVANDTYDYNGDPVIGTDKEYPSIVYAVKKYSDGEIIWEKIYIRSATWKEDGTKEGEIKYDETYPLTLTLNTTSSKSNISLSDYDFYLFELNNVSGYIGAMESTDEAALQILEEETTVVTSRHPVYWNILPRYTDVVDYKYCWSWDSYNSELYYFSLEANTSGWKKVHVARSIRDVTDTTKYEFRFDCQIAKLYKYNGSEWIDIESDDLRKEIKFFSSVYMICMQRERLYKGTHKNNIYTVKQDGLPVGDYYFDSGYDYYYVFSLKKPLTYGATINYKLGDETSTGWIEIKNPKDVSQEDSLKAKAYRFDAVSKSENDWLTYKEKVYTYSNLGTETNYKKAGEWYKLSANNDYDYILTIDGAVYEFDGETVYVGTLEKGNYYIETDNYVYLFKTDTDYKYKTKLEFKEESPYILITTPEGDTSGIKYGINLMKVSKDDSRLSNSAAEKTNYYENTIYIKDVPYSKLAPITHSVDNVDEIHGLNNYMKLFIEYTYSVYESLKPEIDAAQKAVSDSEKDMKNKLGDLYREGWWQDTNYVDGDEQRLYDDAIENLIEVSKPQETYNVSFVDPYGSTATESYISEKHNIYPFINPSIMTAAHIVDLDTGINKWAFIDKISRNYTTRGNTSLTLNTNLKTISQHSFTDVMSTIAEVANDYKGSASKINKTLESLESEIESMSDAAETTIVNETTIVEVNPDDLSTKEAVKAITSVKEFDDYVNSLIEERLKNLVIDGTMIRNGTITTNNIMGNSIKGDIIKAGAINADKIQANAITSDKIKAGAISADKIQAGAITADKIQAGAINTNTAIIDNLIIKAADDNYYKVTTGELGDIILIPQELSEEEISDGIVDGLPIVETDISIEMTVPETEEEEPIPVPLSDIKSQYDLGAAITEAINMNTDHGKIISESIEAINNELWQDNNSLYFGNYENFHNGSSYSNVYVAKITNDAFIISGKEKNNQSETEFAKFDTSGMTILDKFKLVNDSEYGIIIRNI